MADIILELTVAGQALRAKIEQGNGDIPFEITRIVAGAGSSGDPLNQTGVIDPRQEFAVTSKSTVGPETIFQAMLTNVGDPDADPPVPPLAVGYPLGQIGFYAIDPDVGEILYNITQFENPAPVPAASERPWTYKPEFVVTTGNASEVIIQLTPSGWLSQDDLDAHNHDAGAHPAIQARLSDHIGARGEEQHGLADGVTSGFSQANFEQADKDKLGEVMTPWDAWVQNPMDLEIIKAMGLQGGKDMGMQIFRANGTFQAVAGRTYRVICVGGGGGGGAHGRAETAPVLSSNGRNGGATSFGTMLSCNGGLGGLGGYQIANTAGTGNANGGTGGVGFGGIGGNGAFAGSGTGSSSSPGTSGTGTGGVGGHAGSATTSRGAGGGGGGGLANVNGMRMATNGSVGSGGTGNSGSSGTGGAGAGAGGGGAGSGDTSHTNGGHGGNSGEIGQLIFTATANQSIPVTVGLGGIGGEPPLGGDRGRGGNGADGVVIVMW